VTRGSAVARSALVALALLGPAARAADPPKVTARLTPDPLGIDEVATLEIHVTSSGFDSPDLEPRFELENLEIAGGPMQAQSHSWVNGRTSSSFQLLWRLRPLAAGPARVTHLEMRVDEQTVALADQEIEVVESAPPGRAAPPPAGVPADPFEGLFDSTRSQRRRAAAEQPKVRVRTEVEPSNPYVGQQTAYRLVLYTQTDISSFNPLGLPDFRGLWTREVDLPDRVKPQWVELDGERFGRVVMLQRALYPLSAGKFELEPIDVDVVLRVAEAGFFGPFGRNVQQRLRTNPVALGVRPLPAAPPGFSGVVGDLSTKASLDRAETEVGQAATLSIEVESRGNLQGLPAPEIALPAGLTAYAPRPETGQRVTGGALVSHQTWRYVLVPDRAGEFVVPAISFAYFDPASASFRNVNTDPIRLAVRTATESAPVATPAPAAAAAREPERRAPDGVLWAAGAAAVALLLGIGYLLGRRGSGGGAAEPRRRLLEALKHAQHEPPRAAADGFEAAWRAYLAERFGVPSDAPGAGLADRLGARGVPAASGAALAALFEEIDYLRHAPELSQVSHLGGEILERSRRLVRELR
jgi:hypothetical protein